MDETGPVDVADVAVGACLHEPDGDYRVAAPFPIFVAVANQPLPVDTANVEADGDHVGGERDIHGLVLRGREGQGHVRIAEVKNNLSRVIDRLEKTGPVLITRNGRTCAVLLPVGEETDLEGLIFSQSRRLWELIDKSVESGRKRGLTRFEDVPD